MVVWSRSLFAWNISAMTPVTYGAAWLVPLPAIRRSGWMPPAFAETIPTPGAQTSGLSLKSAVGPRPEKSASRSLAGL